MDPHMKVWQNIIYLGEFVYGKQQGVGTYIWKDGRKYEGTFLGGKQHGMGYYYPLGFDKRKGRWDNGKRIAWLDEEDNEIPEKHKTKE